MRVNETTILSNMIFQDDAQLTIFDKNICENHVDFIFIYLFT